jgi:opacity protein-like surface antigen
MNTRLRLAALAAALPALAAAAPPWYGSASIGYSDADSSGLESGNAHDFDSARTSRSRSGLPWRLAAGAMVAPALAVELNYSDYGKEKLEASGSANAVAFPEEVLPQHRTTDRRVSAWGVDVVAGVPLAHGMRLAVRGGAAYATVKTSSHIEAPGGFPFGNGPQDATFTARDRSWAPRVGAGLGWEFAPAWAAEASLEYLGAVGSDFASGSEDRTGRSRQLSAWLGIARRF